MFNFDHVEHHNAVGACRNPGAPYGSSAIPHVVAPSRCHAVAKILVARSISTLWAHPSLQGRAPEAGLTGSYIAHQLDAFAGSPLALPIDVLSWPLPLRTVVHCRLCKCSCGGFCAPVSIVLRFVGSHQGFEIDLQRSYNAVKAQSPTPPTRVQGRCIRFGSP